MEAHRQAAHAGSERTPRLPLIRIVAESATLGRVEDTRNSPEYCIGEISSNRRTYAP